MHRKLSPERANSIFRSSFLVRDEGMRIVMVGRFQPSEKILLVCCLVDVVAFSFVLENLVVLSLGSKTFELHHSEVECEMDAPLAACIGLEALVSRTRIHLLPLLTGKPGADERSDCRTGQNAGCAKKNPCSSEIQRPRIRAISHGGNDQYGPKAGARDESHRHRMAAVAGMKASLQMRDALAGNIEQLLARGRTQVQSAVCNPLERTGDLPGSRLALKVFDIGGPNAGSRLKLGETFGESRATGENDKTHYKQYPTKNRIHGRSACSVQFNLLPSRTNARRIPKYSSLCSGKSTILALIASIGSSIIHGMAAAVQFHAAAVQKSISQ
jgi:hypothetical protein